MHEIECGRQMIMVYYLFVPQKKEQILFFPLLCLISKGEKKYGITKIHQC